MGARPQASELPTVQPLHRLGGLLARWHCWRRHYRTERSYARPAGLHVDPEDELEEMLMSTVEREVERLPQSWQRLVQQLARAECLGLELEDTRSPEHDSVLDHIAYRLRAAGIL